jgi:hypothetical protein
MRIEILLPSILIQLRGPRTSNSGQATSSRHTTPDRGIATDPWGSTVIAFQQRIVAKFADSVLSPSTFPFSNYGSLNTSYRPSKKHDLESPLRDILETSSLVSHYIPQPREPGTKGSLKVTCLYYSKMAGSKNASDKTSNGSIYSARYVACISSEKVV